MTGRDYHFQMVRPGIALYGGRAVAGRRNPMATVVTLHAPVLQVREARTGESVGYGAAYSLSRDSRLAVIGHGNSTGRGIANAVRVAARGTRGRLVEQFGAALALEGAERPPAT